MGQITTHVLDTSRGTPAANMRLELWDVACTPSVRLMTGTTNGDGRLDEPVLSGAALKKSTYEIRFFAGDYFRSYLDDMPEPAFLDVIPVRFGLSDSDSHYHIPLLVSPYGYSTYRGS